jgi:hypothetical protein
MLHARTFALDKASPQATDLTPDFVKNFRTPAVRATVAAAAANIAATLPPFTPSEQKAKSISAEVEKPNKVAAAAGAAAQEEE